MRTDSFINSSEKKANIKEIISNNSCHSNANTQIDAPQDEVKVVLAGNPNVGKSLVFNYLSGLYVDVSNFPGTTISITKGIFKSYGIYDTPGVYGVSSFNDEERVARDVILSGDIILNVVNALHLERDLFLTLQLIDMGKRVTVLLNFADELKKRHITINSQRLSELLGVEVIETSAVNHTGFDKLEWAIQNARIGRVSPEIDIILKGAEKAFSDIQADSAERIMLLEGDEAIAERHKADLHLFNNRETVYIDRRKRVNEIVSEVEYEDSRKGEFFNSLGRYSLNPVTGIPILAVLLTIVYFFIGDFVSQRVVDFTENTIGVGIFEYNVKSFVSKFTPVDITVEQSDIQGNVVDTKEYSFPNGLDSDASKTKEFKAFASQKNTISSFIFQNAFVRLFFGEFGIVTMTVTYLLFLLLPLVLSFYLVMAIMEDSGYLPRLATMLDRTFNYMGLNGRAVIPVILGFGCVTMATITTRLLGTEREKTIITAILQFVIPCSAQLAVIAVLMSGTGAMYFGIYAGTIFMVLIVLSTVLNKMLPGESMPLLIDLPAMRLPKMNNVLKKTFFRAVAFMKEASLWFFVGALAVGFLEITGLLTVWQNAIAPLTTSWLKLPKEAANAFVMGLIRRDFGAAGLFDLSLTPMQITVSLIVITLFVPCIASFVVMLKERGIRQGVIIWLSTWVFAFLIGGVVAQIAM